MALVVPDAGELALLRKLLINATDSENYILHLYKNDYTPDASSGVASFTEADFTNYTAKTLARSDWASPSTVSNKAQSSVSVQQWTCGASGNTIFGYYVTGDGVNASTVLWAERFAITRAIVQDDILNVTPIFNLSSAN
jgi:hypothetical protein